MRLLSRGVLKKIDVVGEALHESKGQAAFTFKSKSGILEPRSSDPEGRARNLEIR